MKKLLFLLMSLMVAGLSVMTSCSSDSTEPTDVTPLVNFIGGAGFTSADATLTAGAVFKVGLNAFSNATSNAKLVNLTITRVFNNNPMVVLDSTINVNSFSIAISTEAQSTAGSETWYYKITDKDNQSKQLSLVITTTAASGPINTFSMKILGAQAAATGSSFASIDGTVYSLSQAKANQAKVDWMYYYGATDFATLAAPDDAHAALVFTNATNGLQTWTIKNATRFRLITDVINWDAITNDEVIIQQAVGLTESRIPALMAGKYISFVAASGKKGIIKVESITTGDTGEISISVKVQQ